jgi:hypothetical protein
MTHRSSLSDAPMLRAWQIKIVPDRIIPFSRHGNGDALMSMRCA